MSLKDEAYKAIDDANNDTGKAAGKILTGSRSLALYTIQVGLDFLKSRRRATARRGLRDAVVKPEFTRKPGGVFGSVSLSKRSREKLATATRDLFLTWCIGDTPLGDATKEFLIETAQSERSSAKGHLRNAVFYECLAEPMQSGQVVRDYWKEVKAVKLIRDELWRDTEEKDVKFT